MQGSAADLAKSAMVAVHAALSSLAGGGGRAARLLLQIHDELLLEVEEGALEQVSRGGAGR